MTKQRLNAIASLLIIAGLVLITTGVNGPALLWQVGLIILVAAMALSFATHWGRSGEDS